ncbi:MAG TPA: F0F1 ATP synthase subunit B [Dongiaceae bacterium]|nr:F0F1 ATP synthase subunit B [Dongiaceae bacterium]
MDFLRDPEIWVAVAFIVFIALFAKPILKAMNKGLDDRGARIKANLDEARRLREEAEALLSEYQAKQKSAAKEAADLLAHAREEAETLRKDAAANLEAMLKRRERMALDKIAQAEAQALADVRNEAVDLAVAAASHILTRHLPLDRAGALIDQSIGELEKKLH